MRMTQEQREILFESGRELAVHLMTQAVEKAETDEQLTNQLFVMQICAFHILATLNQITQNHHAEDQIWTQFFYAMKQELALLKRDMAENNLDWVGPRNSIEETKH